MSGQRGFTLIELMIAIAMLGISTAAFATVLTPSQAEITDIGHHDAAVALAADVVEEIRAAPYAERTAIAQRWSARDDIATPPGADVDVALSEPRRGVTSIRVDVTWKTYRGHERSFRLDSAKGDY